MNNYKTNMSNFVSMLNEYCQYRQIPTPVYKTIDTKGPSHMPVFTMKVVVDNREFEATATKKQIAKYKCAEIAAKELDIEQHLKDRVKIYKYKICEILTPLENVWNDEIEDIVITIKRTNDMDDYQLKTIKLKISK
jgi:hypothetical protein